MSDTAEVVQIPAAALAELQTAAAQLRDLERTRAAEAQAAETRIMLARGEVDSVVKATQARVQEAENRAAEFAIKGSLAQALTSHRLSDQWAGDQLQVLMRGDFVALPTPNGFDVRSRDGRSVADHVAGKLAQETFAHFRARDNSPALTGGRAAQPGQQNAAGLPFTEPATAGHALISHALAKTAERVAAQGGRPAQGQGGTDHNGQAMNAAGFGLYAPLPQMR